MRKFLLAAAMAAAAAVAVAPSVASANGYVGVNWNTVDDGVTEDEAIGAEAAFAFEGSSAIGFEVDFAYADTDPDSTLGAAGHIYTRNDSYLFGGLIGVSDNDGSGTTWFGGLEANKYFDRWTLAGAVLYGSNDDADFDGWGGTVAARVFPTDNFRIGAQASWAQVDVAGVDQDTTILGAGAEYQFAAFPLSINGGYNNIDVDGVGDADAWTLGVRWNFGGQSLYDRDRRGASQADLTGFGAAF